VLSGISTESQIFLHCWC